MSRKTLRSKEATAEHGEQDHQALVEAILGQLTGCGNLHPRHLKPAAAQVVLDLGGHLLDVAHIGPVARHPHVQFIICARVAEPFHGVRVT